MFANCLASPPIYGRNRSVPARMLPECEPLHYFLSLHADDSQLLTFHLNHFLVLTHAFTFVQEGKKYCSAGIDSCVRGCGHRGSRTI